MFVFCAQTGSLSTTMLRYYVVATCLLGLASAKLTKVADITTKAHGVAGTLYAKDAKHLVIKGFTYDGAGPDAFFWVGTDGSPGRHGAVVLPYPFTGKFYEYEDPDTPKLEPGTSYDGSVDIELTLPEDGPVVTDLAWFSVWCRRFSANFGDLYFPAEFKLESDGSAEPATTTTAATPAASDKPPKDLPPPVVISNNNLDEQDRSSAHDDDAYAEPESEPEPSAASATSHSLMVILAITVLPVIIG